MASPDDVMPWVGLYIALASFICTLAMTLDAVQAFWKWKLWFPNRFFNLNAATITLIAIAMKLLVDLNTSKLTSTEKFTKLSSICFLVTMLANFLPSLGLMDDKELVTNIVALGILVVTIIANILIQLYTRVFFVFTRVTIYALTFTLLWPFSVAFSVSACRKILEHRYKESQRLVSTHQEKRFSCKELKGYVKKHYMMIETHNPQFVIACSPVSSAFGVICSIVAFYSTSKLLFLLRSGEYHFYGTSDYKWSTQIILMVQSVGVVVGSIAPIFRCFASIESFSLSKKWSKNQINVFRVENHWVLTLLQWKRIRLHSNIRGRHWNIVFHYIKNTFLNFCIALHIFILAVCKAICLVPRSFFILLSCSLYLYKSFLKRYREVIGVFKNNTDSEIEEYMRYAVHLEEEVKLSSRLLRNMLQSVTQLLHEYEKKEPRNLMKLLEKSRGFNGLVEFDNDKVPPLYPEETHNCWSLVVVTLTSIAIALPNITNGQFQGILASIREGLEIVRHIEECLDVDDDSVKTRESAMHLWKEIEVYRTWLHMDLQKKAHEGKTSKEILKWLGDEAIKHVMQFKSIKRPNIDHSRNKFILACSMYRVSQTILVHCNEHENWSTDDELLEWISTIIADILVACFTNLPHVIKLKCHHHAIEKRGDSIRNAAKLLGRSKRILKFLKARQHPNIDADSMAYIDKWRTQLMSQIPNGGNDGASSIMIQPASSSTSNESIIITIM
ncbi:hypothetical protein QVD17_14697 [Tagetes erecta]|uniref:Uncharacterized protein n=1 Tax=Tagetes erecta TaxID=13708 RepID=A0AAD8NRW4_TARER|nr:hypothetical protein QVD17_14697 [Tagetes erecta]